MPVVTLHIKSSKNEGLIMSPSELLELYFWGIPLCTQEGKELSNQIIKQKILDAQNAMEGWLGVKLLPGIVVETKHFIRKEYQDWSFLKMTYQVVKGLALEGYLNNILQLTMPEHWMSVKKSDDGRSIFRNIFIIPNTGGIVVHTGASFSGLTPQLNWFGNKTVPNYWKIKYRTGFDDPEQISDLYDFIGKMAAVPLLTMLGDVLLGIGLSSQSLSIDGLSQSLSILKSQQGGIFAARINQYLSELKDNLTRVQSSYRGILFDAF